MCAPSGGAAACAGVRRAAAIPPLLQVGLFAPCRMAAPGEDVYYAAVRDYVTALKNGRFKPFSLTERRARAATRNQVGGPSS